MTFFGIELNVKLRKQFSYSVGSSCSISMSFCCSNVIKKNSEMNIQTREK